MSLLNKQPAPEATLIERMIHTYWYQPSGSHVSEQRWTRVLEAVAAEVDSWASEPEAYGNQSVALTYQKVAARLRGLSDD